MSHPPRCSRNTTRRGLPLCGICATICLGWKSHGPLTRLASHPTLKSSSSPAGVGGASYARAWSSAAEARTGAQMCADDRVDCAGIVATNARYEEMGKHPALDSNATPEARELERKRAELTRLESELADRELEAATLQNELRGFEWEYFRTVGRLYAELDAVESQIANLHAHQRPNDAEAVRLAADASARATES